MNKKILTIILGMILLTGGVLAARTIYPITDIQMPPNVVSGSEFQANFVFAYPADGENEDNSPLIIQLNITAEDSNYSVGKGEFNISGHIEKYFFNSILGWFLDREVSFNCTDSAPYTIEHSIDTHTIEDIPDGIFYCYSKDADLELNELDDVYLNITSNIAIWPGTYNMSASFFYLNDTTAPIITITDKSYFDQYFRDGSYVDFNVIIIETNGLADYRARITNHTPQISFSKEWISGNIYHFYQTLPNKNVLVEGDYILNATAEDLANNEGSDSVIIKIDLTGPNITLVEPTGLVSEEFTIKFNVTDEKAGVNNESVYCRLREIVNGQICPETGGYLGDGETPCTTTEWIKLTNSTNSLFETDVNATELGLSSNEYWLDAIAEDILGNKAEWIADED